MVTKSNFDLCLDLCLDLWKNLWKPIKNWLNNLEIQTTTFAKLCAVIPAQCPFERNISIGKFTIKIPPLCHLNPLYEELIQLRYKALIFLEQKENQLKT